MATWLLVACDAGTAPTADDATAEVEPSPDATPDVAEPPDTADPEDTPAPEPDAGPDLPEPPPPAPTCLAAEPGAEDPTEALFDPTCLLDVDIAIPYILALVGPPELFTPGTTVPLDWSDFRGWMFTTPGLTDEFDLIGVPFEGTLSFDEASTIPGQPVSGSFDAKLMGPP